MSLSAHLLSLSTPHPYTAATEHPFLTAAGHLTLPGERLALWLSQDRIYAAEAYPRFTALLIAKIPFGSSDAGGESRNRRTLKCLVGALQNIVREVNFFEDTARQWSLDIGAILENGEFEHTWLERKGTRDYTAEMVRIASLGSLGEGLVFLWAMERVYLDAWRYVKSKFPQSLNAARADEDKTAGAIRALTDSWTNEGFVAFVDELADLVDEYGADKKKAEDIWARVIELEVDFWPEFTIPSDKKQISFKLKFQVANHLPVRDRLGRTQGATGADEKPSSSPCAAFFL
ncbi:hypothetical protein BJ138DRAFT_648068 [Hygrophoropsis aurantiaca]|uniref:Uncharacterized protein n=1 Tax=Hygrophoropsis aurantiaca TaxID=72124 RepID=A0ACB8AJ91_9AGAM|nr:hypothetical protein BJ138DRAFT_648068 [Hygrophoropsis aurantiaca]